MYSNVFILEIVEYTWVYFITRYELVKLQVLSTLYNIKSVIKWLTSLLEKLGELNELKIGGHVAECNVCQINRIYIIIKKKINLGVKGDYTSALKKKDGKKTKSVLEYARRKDCRHVCDVTKLILRIVNT